MTSPYRGDRLAQWRDAVDKEGLPPFLRAHREEEATVRHGYATIVWYRKQNSILVRLLV